MILVDTSVWIDHLRRPESRLVDALGQDEVGSHPLVVEELALGSLKGRTELLGLLERLTRFGQVSHEEVRTFVDSNRLWGRGVGAVDAHLLASVRIVPGARLWTRDKRLRLCAVDVGVDVVPWS